MILRLRLRKLSPCLVPDFLTSCGLSSDWVTDVLGLPLRMTISRAEIIYQLRAKSIEDAVSVLLPWVQQSRKKLAHRVGEGTPPKSKLAGIVAFSLGRLLLLLLEPTKSLQRKRVHGLRIRDGEAVTGLY